MAINLYKKKNRTSKPMLKKNDSISIPPTMSATLNFNSCIIDFSVKAGGMMVSMQKEQKKTTILNFLGISPSQDFYSKY